jgi:RNA polymerase sigma-70 factor, ECF subfamily
MLIQGRRADSVTPPFLSRTVFKTRSGASESRIGEYHFQNCRERAAPVRGCPLVVCGDRDCVDRTDARRWSAVSDDWSALYSSHARDIASFLLKLTGDREEASDLMQETFVRAMRSNTNAGELHSARAWLYRIAANLAHDHHRRTAVLRFVRFSGREEGASGISDPQVELVRRALRTLPFARATALLLHYDAGFARKEIAELEGISEEAVKSRLARGRDAFARAFERLGGRMT